MSPTRVAIMGAAGRDFHDFNTVFRGDDGYEVVAFTHTPTQNIGELDELPQRRYPPELAGEMCRSPARNDERAASWSGISVVLMASRYGRPRK